MNDLLDLMHAADAIDSGRWLMKCPAHRGALASSLEVVLREGRYRLRCIAGCDPEAIFAAARSRISLAGEGCVTVTLEMP